VSASSVSKSRKARRHLPPSEKYELWVSVLTGQATPVESSRVVYDELSEPVRNSQDLWIGVLCGVCVTS
jgi:hypothetical protein